MESQQKIQSIIKPDFSDKKSMSRWVLVAICAVLIVMEIGFLYWLVPGKVEEINTKNREIEQLTSEVNELESVNQVLASVDQVSLNNDLQLAEYALPSEKSVAGLISGLTNLASSSGTTVSGIEVTYGKVSTQSGSLNPGEALQRSTSDVKLSNDVVGIPITMNVKGSSAQILELISKIQQSMPLLGTQSMGYKFFDEGGNQGSLSILIYSQPAAKFNKANLSGISALSNTEQAALDRLSERTNILQ